MTKNIVAGLGCLLLSVAYLGWFWWITQPTHTSFEFWAYYQTAVAEEVLPGPPTTPQDVSGKHRLAQGTLGKALTSSVAPSEDGVPGFRIAAADGVLSFRNPTPGTPVRLRVVAGPLKAPATVHNGDTEVVVSASPKAQVWTLDFSTTGPELTCWVTGDGDAMVIRAVEIGPL